MPVLRGPLSAFDPLQSLARSGGDSDPFTGTEARRQVYEAALAELQPLLAPAIAYAVYPVRRRQEHGLEIAQGEVLRSRVVSELFGAAPEVVIMVYTIGAAAETRVSQLQQAGDYALSYTLDALATLALSEVGYVACQEIDRLAAQKGVRASIPLNPGTSHWPTGGQPLVVALAGASAIGVSVRESFLLQPLKSNSMAIALGHDVLTPDKGSSCDYCEHPELCGRKAKAAS